MFVWFFAMRFSSIFRSPRARTQSGAVPAATPVASRNQRTARAILPAIVALGVLSLGVLGLRAQNSAPPTIAVSRHALNNNGRIEGSAQQLSGENLSLNNGSFFGGDLLVPGNPKVKANGKPNWKGQRNGGGSISPSNYQVSINSSVELGYLVTQSDPIALDNVATPPNSRGNRSVNVNNARDVAAIGAWSGVRDLNLNGNVDVAVPAGTYGNFNVNGGALVLGTPNDTSPDVYNFQNLNFNGQSQLKVVGPVVVAVRNGMNVNGILGSSQNQAWLRLNISNGGLSLNSGATIYGAVRTPGGSANINGTVWGSVQADRLTVNRGGAIKLGAIVQPTPVPTPLPTATPKPVPTATPVPTAIPTPMPTGAPLATVTPILECVENLGNAQYRAHFGTNVPGAQAQIIPVGTTQGNENQFTPAPIDRDQPTSFLPGRTVDSFQVVFNGSNLSWTLRGRTVTASANSNGCPIPTPTPTATPTPAPTATPIPVPTATPTPIPNRAPIAVDDAYAVDEDGVLNIQTPGVLSNDSDADGDNFEAQLVANPTHGTLDLFLGGGFRYTPVANYNGADSFTYRANDGTLNSQIATVSISVNPVNDAPVGRPDFYTIDEDTRFSINAPGFLSNDSDPDGDNLSAIMVSQPNYGGYSFGPNGDLSYSPAPNFNGTDSFTYRVSDGTLQSDPVTVTIIVRPVNDAPVAADVDAGSVGISETLNGTLSATDVDDDASALTFNLVQAPAHGMATVNADGTFTYRTLAGTFYSGADSFTYRATDAGGLSSNIATVSLMVAKPPTPVVARPDEYFSDDNPSSFDGDLLANDSGDGPLSAVAFEYGETRNGYTFRADGKFTFFANPGFVGDDTFTYRAKDVNGNLSEPTTVTIHVSHVNHAPVANADQYGVGASGKTTISAPGVLDNDYDPDIRAFGDRFGDKLTISLLPRLPQHPPALGTVTLRPDGSFDYQLNTPFPTQRTSDDFYYSLDDNQGRKSVGRVTMLIDPQNNAPVAQNQTLRLPGLTMSVPVNFLASDADGDRFNYQILTLPTQGVLRNQYGSVLSAGYYSSLDGVTYERSTYGPGPNPNDALTFLVRDYRGLQSETATIKIRIPISNHRPVAVADEATAAGTVISIPVLQNDSDPDGDELRITDSSSGANGTVSRSNDGKTITYTPGVGFVGDDSFSYWVSDGDATAQATVTVHVTKPFYPGRINGYIGVYTPTYPHIVGIDTVGQSTQSAIISNDNPSSNYGSARYTILMISDSLGYDSAVLRGPANESGKSGQAAHWRIRYFDMYGGPDFPPSEITDQVTSAQGWKTYKLVQGQGIFVRVEVTPDSTVEPGTAIDSIFRISSERDPNSVTEVTARSAKGFFPQ